jgi:hypothetical protein
MDLSMIVVVEAAVENACTGMNENVEEAASASMWMTALMKGTVNVAAYSFASLVAAVATVAEK